jgi:hypothetical protein
MGNNPVNPGIDPLGEIDHGSKSGSAFIFYVVDRDEMEYTHLVGCLAAVHRRQPAAFSSQADN